MILPKEFADAPRIVLPDRSGYLLLLDMRGTPHECPRCHRAMAFCVVKQRIERAPAALTAEYSCIGCEEKGTCVNPS